MWDLLASKTAQDSVCHCIKGNKFKEGLTKSSSSSSKHKLESTLPVYVSVCRVGANRMEPGSPRCCAIGQEAMGMNWNIGSST